MDTINIFILYPQNAYFNIKGKRLYPNPCINKRNAFKLAKKTQIYLILEKNDTLYILLNLSDKRSKFYHILGVDTINDSIINYFSKIYNVSDTIIDKILYYKIFTNLSDSIVIFREKNDGKLGAYFIQSMKLGDRYIHFDKLKIGESQENFFRKFLGIKFSYKKRDFVVFIADIKASSVSWYYRHYCSKNKDEFFYCEKKMPFVGLHYFIKFRNGKIVTIEKYLR